MIPNSSVAKPHSKKIGKICSLLYPLHPAPKVGCSILLAADCSTSTALGLTNLDPPD